MNTLDWKLLNKGDGGDAFLTRGRRTAFIFLKINWYCTINDLYWPRQIENVSTMVLCISNQTFSELVEVIIGLQWSNFILFWTLEHKFDVQPKICKIWTKIVNHFRKAAFLSNNNFLQVCPPSESLCRRNISNLSAIKKQKPKVCTMYNYIFPHYIIRILSDRF